MNLYPNNPIILNALGIVFLQWGDFLKARTIFVTLFQASETLKPSLKFTLMNNIAYTNILINRVDLLQEAAIYSAEAYQNAPWEPAIIGTRGAVLVELGQLAEGIMLLKVAMAKHSSAQGKAANACHAAIGESRRGNVSESQNYFQIARSLDPQCYLLEYTAKKLAGSQG